MVTSGSLPSDAGNCCAAGAGVLALLAGGVVPLLCALPSGSLLFLVLRCRGPPAAGGGVWGSLVFWVCGVVPFGLSCRRCWCVRLPRRGRSSRCRRCRRFGVSGFGVSGLGVSGFGVSGFAVCAFLRSVFVSGFLSFFADFLFALRFAL